MKISRILKNNSGVVFITILMITMVLTIFTIGVASISISQAKFTETAEEDKQADQVGKGIVGIIQTELDKGNALPVDKYEASPALSYNCSPSATGLVTGTSSQYKVDCNIF
jgi:hypothetical protein